MVRICNRRKKLIKITFNVNCLKVTWFALVAIVTGLLILSANWFNFREFFLAYVTQNVYYCELKDGYLAENKNGTIFHLLFGEGDREMPVVVYNRSRGDPNSPDFYVKRDRQANEIAGKIEEIYFKTMANFLRSASQDELFSANFLAFRCHPQYDPYCGGLGDRIRGLMSVFFIAFGLGHVFRIDSTRTSILADYFKINEDLYPGIEPETFYTQISKKWLPPAPVKLDFMNIKYEDAFAKWGSNRDPTCSPPNHYESIRTNSLAGLEGALKNPKFKQIFSKLLPEQLSNPEKFDASLLISAFLRAVFRNPTKRLSETFEQCVIENAGGHDVWVNSYKIGVQIRQGEPGRFMITNRQLLCFVDFVREIVEKRRKRFPTQQIILFLTVDSDTVFSEMRQKFDKSLKNVLIIGSSDGEACASLLKFRHSDWSPTLDSSWYGEAKAYVDWLALRQMDRLVISRSGFGEMASFYSLVPTQRFSHWASDTIDKCVFHQFNQIGSFLRFELYSDGKV